MERLYGISYAFTETPLVTSVSKTGKITYNPKLIYSKKDERDVIEVKTIYSNIDFSLTYNQMINKSSDIFQRENVYSVMRKRSRESQERIISEYICTVIMQELRKYDDDLVFLISDDFQSEKIIGRLGYLKLPLHRTHIMFVSRNIASFMTNYVEPYAIPPQNDLKLLCTRDYRGKVVGAYPEEGVLSMIRTYFCSFAQEDIYPIRINLFSQALNKKELNCEKERIERIFNGKTELYDVIGGTGNEKTRLPEILIKCEEYIKHEKRK